MTHPFGIDPKIERKLGAEILETVASIQILPKDQPKAFIVLRKRLEKRVKRYQEYTGSDFLLHKQEDYGFETSHHGTE